MLNLWVFLKIDVTLVIRWETENRDASNSIGERKITERNVDVLPLVAADVGVSSFFSE
jgi:hypothetical protein